MTGPQLEIIGVCLIWRKQIQQMGGLPGTKLWLFFLPSPCWGSSGHVMKLSNFISWFRDLCVVFVSYNYKYNVCWREEEERQSSSSPQSANLWLG